MIKSERLENRDFSNQIITLQNAKQTQQETRK